MKLVSPELCLWSAALNDGMIFIASLLCWRRCPWASYLHIPQPDKLDGPEVSRTLNAQHLTHHPPPINLHDIPTPNPWASFSFPSLAHTRLSWFYDLYLPLIHRLRSPTTASSADLIISYLYQWFSNFSKYYSHLEGQSIYCWANLENFWFSRSGVGLRFFCF